jgi:hypothetical protein
MTTDPTWRDIGIWAPRIVGIGLAGFLGLFALDSFVNHAGILKTIIAVTMGLAPALIVLASVVIGWRHPGVGAVVFSGLAVLYIVSALDNPGWILLISGPLVLEAALFLASWRLQAKRR